MGPGGQKIIRNCRRWLYRLILLEVRPINPGHISLTFHRLTHARRKVGSSQTPATLGDLWMWLQLTWLKKEIVRGPIGVVWDRFGAGLGPSPPGAYLSSGGGSSMFGVQAAVSLPKTYGNGWEASPPTLSILFLGGKPPIGRPKRRCFVVCLRFFSDGYFAGGEGRCGWGEEGGGEGPPSIAHQAIQSQIGPQESSRSLFIKPRPDFADLLGPNGRVPPKNLRERAGGFAPHPSPFFGVLFSDD